LEIFTRSNKKKDILDLPVLKQGESLNDFKHLSLPEKWLIGYHLRRGTARPSLTFGDRCSWSKDKIRIANSLYKIRHWNIIYGDAFDYPVEKNVTEFIDPPYTIQKHKYNFHKIDYVELSKLIKVMREKNNQIIVCGNSGDKWLDFKPMVVLNGTNKKTIEHIWSNHKTMYDNQIQSLF